MTNKFDNWSRLLKVIERFGKTINGFAMKLGLQRAENLYHIRKGNYGISDDLAERIIKYDRDIDKTWLLTGVGNMLKEECIAEDKIPFYFDEVENVLPNLSELKPHSYVTMPYQLRCDIVVRSFSKPMNDTVSAAHDLFLKRVAIEEVVQGNEYVLILDRPEDNVIWRRVRLVEKNSSNWRLVARNRDDFKDIYIDRSEVKEAWRVIARLAILES